MKAKFKKEDMQSKIIRYETSPLPLPGVGWCFGAYEIRTETYIYSCRPNKPVNFYGYTNIIQDLKAYFINEDLKTQFTCHKTPPGVWCFVTIERN